MPIEMDCAKCGKRLSVDDTHVGKMARCPSCGHIYRVPGGTEAGLDATTAPDVSPDTQAWSPSQQSETPQAWFLKIDDGRVFGPVPQSELEQWRNEGRISTTSELRLQGEAEWRPASVLFNDLQQPKPLAPASAPDEPLHIDSSSPFSDIVETVPTDIQPHRAGTILMLGAIGVFCSCFPAALIGWVLGAQDLRAMRDGRMDPAGRSTTQVGVAFSVLGSIIWGVGWLVNLAGALS